MTTTTIGCTKMRMKNICRIEGRKAIENMLYTAKGAEDKKSLSAAVESKRIDPLVIILEEIIPSNIDIDNGEIYDVMTGETIRRINE